MFFFFNDTATTEIYTLSLHDALPISIDTKPQVNNQQEQGNENDVRHTVSNLVGVVTDQDRKSTRLNSSHSQISYAVFCLKKKKHDTRVAIRNDPSNKRDADVYVISSA